MLIGDREPSRQPQENDHILWSATWIKIDQKGRCPKPLRIYGKLHAM